MNIHKKPYYADSLAFFDYPGLPPVFGPVRPRVSLAHLTSVRPFIKDYDAALAEHRDFRKTALSNPETHEVLSSKDLGSTDTMGILFGMQHMPEKMTLRRMQVLHANGVRVMPIGYDGQNEYGCGFKAEGGLTTRGLHLIEWMGACGMVLDVSHANHATAAGALEFISQSQMGSSIKVMASHSACLSIFPHPRNIANDVMKQLGYIGIPAITFYLADKNCRDYLRKLSHHVSHTILMTGIGKVGIGSDCPYIDADMNSAWKNFDRMTKMLQTKGEFGEYFPDRPEELILNGSQMFNIFEKELTLEEFSDTAIQNICGLNFRSFLANALQ